MNFKYMWFTSELYKIFKGEITPILHRSENEGGGTTSQLNLQGQHNPDNKDITRKK